LRGEIEESPLFWRNSCYGCQFLMRSWIRCQN
jgi:hypothetical protein